MFYSQLNIIYLSSFSFAYKLSLPPRIRQLKRKSTGIWESVSPIKTTGRFLNPQSIHGRGRNLPDIKALFPRQIFCALCELSG